MAKNTPKKSKEPKGEAQEIVESDTKQEQLVQEVVQHVYQRFSGPIPPPQILAAYEDIMPNATNRIFAMAEEQSKHRRESEKKEIQMESRNTLIGIISGLTIGLATIIAGTVAIMNDHEVAGSFIGSSGLVGLVSVFIYGSKSKSRSKSK